MAPENLTPMGKDESSRKDAFPGRLDQNKFVDQEDYGSS
jgi:hypothetical protein